MRGFDEEFGAFLHCDAAEEGDDFLVEAFVDEVVVVASDGVDGVVDGDDLVGWDAVFLDDRVAGEVGDGDDFVCGFHASFLDVEDDGVDLSAGAVEVCGVDVDDEWFAGGLFGCDACWVGEPVVGVDYVEVVFLRDDVADDGVVAYFLQELAAVAAGEVEFAFVVGLEVLEAVAHVEGAQFVVVVGVGVGDELGFDFDVVELSGLVGVANLFVADGDVVSSDYVLDFAFVFVAESFRDDEKDFEVRDGGQPSGDAVASCSESSADVRRKLPSEH